MSKSFSAWSLTMADVSESRSNLLPPIMIAYVPESSLLLKPHSNHCHSVMGATGSGKTSVSTGCLVVMTRN